MKKTQLVRTAHFAGCKYMQFVNGKTESLVLKYRHKTKGVSPMFQDEEPIQMGHNG